MDKKTLQQAIIILPIILIAGIFGYCKYLLFPLNDKIKQKKLDLDTIKRSYEEATMKASRLSRLQQENISLKQEIEELKKVLPESKDLPNLIRILTKKMGEHKLIWERLAPGNPMTKEYYVEQSYTIPFKSSYHDLAMFLTEIGQMERIFATRFSRLGISTDAKDERITISGDLTFLFYTAKG